MINSIVKTSTLACILVLMGCGIEKDTPSSTKPDSGVDQEAPRTITAVDGYIRDANLTDASGQAGAYTSKGKYTFDNTIKYPITLTGGFLEDTDASFDITLTSESGLVISPITSFVKGDANLRAILESIFPDENLEEDYIDTNNEYLAKLSQLLYVMHKDTTLLNAFKSRVALDDLSSLYDLFEAGKIEIHKTFAGVKVTNYTYFLDKVFALTMETSGYEVELQSAKANLDVEFKWPVLKTGQTTIYHTNDDGTLERGTDRNYTDHGDGTVTDNITNLMWQQEDDNKKKLTWNEAKGYCYNLKFAGKNDWRLPSMKELKSIVDFGKDNPAIDGIFKNTNNSFYWSASIEVTEYTPKLVWCVHFRNGNDDHSSKAPSPLYDYFVRCVR